MSKNVANSLDGFSDKLVSRFVTEGVVYSLKAVDIGYYYCEGYIVRLYFFFDIVPCILEGGAVFNTRE